MIATPSARLAIIVPTHRFDEGAKHALAQIASIGGEDIVVHIADNSENSEKHLFLHQLAAKSNNVVITCHNRNIGAIKNWIYLVREQQAPYLCLAGDDDVGTAAFFRAGLNIVTGEEGCSAASGLLISVATSAKTEDISMYTPTQRLEPQAIGRISNYNHQNSLAYAVTERNIIAGFMDYMECCPTNSAFDDYLLAFHILSIGSYRINRNGYVYIYNAENWASPQNSLRSYERYYESAGFSKEFSHFAKLHFAVASLHFFLSRFRHPKLDDSEAIAIATYLYTRFMQDFRAHYRINTNIFATIFKGDAAAMMSLRSLMSRAPEKVSVLFDDFIRLMLVFSPTNAALYRDFYRSTGSNDNVLIQRGASFRERMMSKIMASAPKT